MRCSSTSTLRERRLRPQAPQGADRTRSAARRRGARARPAHRPRRAEAASALRWAAQRVALARALVNRPAVLLLDEPLGALDLKLRKQMQVELKQIQREVGITFVYVTHDQEEALSMSDRIAVMNEGRVMQCGAPRGRLRAPERGVRRRLHRDLEPDRGHGRGRRQGADRQRTAHRRGAARWCRGGDTVNLSVRPEKIAVDDDVEAGMVSLDGTVEAACTSASRPRSRSRSATGIGWSRSSRPPTAPSADDRWEPGMKREDRLASRALPRASLN